MSNIVRRLITREDIESGVWAEPNFRNVSATGVTIGVSGSPATIVELSVASGYHNLLPLQVKATPSGLGTGESATIHIIAVLDDGSTAEIASRTTAAGSTATETFTITDFDFSLIPDGKRIVTVRVTAESSATATSATMDATIVALQLSKY
ncbi:hypothetical protein J7K27_02455 [Candidatus Bathyarchaeota archaeon]|nr:hypothetical protein [Candidatus Bathyarchaeota archaeon]